MGRPGMQGFASWFGERLLLLAASALYIVAMLCAAGGFAISPLGPLLGTAAIGLGLVALSVARKWTSPLFKAGLPGGRSRMVALLSGQLFGLATLMGGVIVSGIGALAGSGEVGALGLGLALLGFLLVTLSEKDRGLDPAVAAAPPKPIINPPPS